MRPLLSILFLIISNFFMTFAWYGHLQFKKWNILQSSGLFSIILISWGIAFFEYVFQVPGNRIGSDQLGGPFNLFQLKMIQEVITLVVFSVFAVFVLKEPLQWRYLVSFAFLLGAVYFMFKKT